MKSLSRGLLGGLIAGALGASAQAQDYPSRPIRMIVPFGPGGVTDITARTVAPLIGEALQATIVVENRAGGSTIIGTDAAAKSKPDGYTLLLASGGALAANPVLFKQMPYDAIRDLTGVSMIGTLPYVLVVNPSTPLATAADLIAMAKAKPGTLTYASAGTGSGNHLAAELFANVTGVNLIHVPYKSGGAMVSDLMGGVVTLSFSGLPAALQHIKSGKLKALGVSSAERNSGLPDTPTLIESGAPGYVLNEWTGIFVPAGTPAAIVQQLNAAIGKVLRTSEATAKLKGIGADASPSAPARLDEVLREDFARWTKLAQTVKFEQQ